MLVVREAETNTNTYTYPGAQLRVLLGGDPATRHRAMLGVVEVAPGARLPAGEGFSSHPCEEFAYVVSGHMQLWVEGREILLGPGDAVFIAPGERHYVLNPGSIPTRAVFVLSPPIPLGS